MENLDKIYQSQMKDKKKEDEENEENGSNRERSELGERKKILIDPQLTTQEIRKKFGVSEDTALRAKKRGWLYLNYHTRIEKRDDKWFEENYKLLKEEIKQAMISHLGQMGVLKGEINKYLYPFDEEDLIEHVLTQMLGKSGYKAREDKSWRFSQYYIYIKEFIRESVRYRHGPLKAAVPLDEITIDVVNKKEGSSQTLEEEILGELEPEEPGEEIGFKEDDEREKEKNVKNPNNKNS